VRARPALNVDQFVPDLIGFVSFPIDVVHARFSLFVGYAARTFMALAFVG
jgi:hypothetical protein